ncbi:hypothetical protein [Pelagibacterium sp.]|uniref:hypothetical protein n=1 Tax=Pelagibacterium sp. TaxID=1967288 RepID=UPI003BAAC013
MVALSFKFSVHGYMFQEGIKALEEAFVAASDALESALAAKQTQLSDYVLLIEGGGLPIGEWDDDGNRLWDQEEVLAMHIETTSEAIMALRKSTVIALYHHWERAIRKSTGVPADGKHSALIDAAVGEGIDISPRLEAVRCLVNLLKHDNERWAKKLRCSWPDVLSDFDGQSKFNDWYQAVTLSREQVCQVFGIVKTSGPVATTRPN